MESKHTPGPWSYRGMRGDSGERHEIGLDNPIVGGLGVRGDEFMCVQGVCTEADARLMASSPELLIKLAEAANYIDTLGGDSKPYRAAIRKATQP